MTNLSHAFLLFLFCGNHLILDANLHALYVMLSFSFPKFGSSLVELMVVILYGCDWSVSFIHGLNIAPQRFELILIPCWLNIKLWLFLIDSTQVITTSCMNAVDFDLGLHDRLYHFATSLIATEYLRIMTGHSLVLVSINWLNWRTDTRPGLQHQLFSKSLLTI